MVFVFQDCAVYCFVKASNVRAKNKINRLADSVQRSYAALSVATVDDFTRKVSSVLSRVLRHTCTRTHQENFLKIVSEQGTRAHKHCCLAPLYANAWFFLEIVRRRFRLSNIHSRVKSSNTQTGCRHRADHSERLFKKSGLLDAMHAVLLETLRV